MRSRWMLVMVGIATAVAGALGTYGRYRRDLAAAVERVAAGSRLVETPHGCIEYGETGEGTPVLSVHGAGGGYDQGLLLGQRLLGGGYRVIAPSRFGYLGSPLPADASVAAQTRAYACLLDCLKLRRVVVAGFSAGGLSALQFALDYPERTEALVLAAAVTYSDHPSTQEERLVSAINQVIGSDWVYWLAVKMAKRQMLELLGVPARVAARAGTADGRVADQILEEMCPMGARLPGIALDQRRYFPRDHPLDRIAAPALVLHARDDGLVAFTHAEHAVARIPGARLVALDHGGHFLLGHGERLRELVRDFLAR